MYLLYNFGTTSMFFSMGKKKKSYIYEDDEIQQEKCITIAFVGDERICDGYYYAASFKQLSRYLRKPELLEGPAKEKENILIWKNFLKMVDFDTEMCYYIWVSANGSVAQLDRAMPF